MRLDRLVVPALVAAAGALGACKYSFSNPADRLAVGEISGRAVADVHALGDPAPEGGIAVSLKGSAFSQITHPTGRFTLLPLPPGKHTLVFRRGTQLALTRQVELALGPDGQPEGVTLGDVEVPFAGVIEGMVSEGSPGGIVVDEITGLNGFVGWGPNSGGSSGRYDLPGASVGLHRLKFGLADSFTMEEWVGGPLEVTIPPQGQSSVTHAALVAVHPAAGTGRVRVRLLSLHRDIALGDLTLNVSELIHGVFGPTATTSPDGTVEFDAPEGIYDLNLSAQGPHAAEVTNPPPTTVVVLDGEVADAGTLYLVPPGIPAAAQQACEQPADCGLRPCDAGRCNDWAPPPVLPATVPTCYSTVGLCTNFSTCSIPNGPSGICIDVGSGAQACVPCGQQCTVDQVELLQGAQCPD